MNNFTQTITSLLLMLPICSFAQASDDYTTTVKVNGVELNQALSATQIEKLLGNTSQKTTKAFSECSGNYEYSSSTASGKKLMFEIYSEDNPQIKSETFYKGKNNFQQLGTTKGRVWLSWSNAPAITDTILINNKPITNLYSINQFKKDFPNSAKTGTSVLILTASEAKEFLKNPAEFETGYRSYVDFSFKNGKLSKLEINQGMAC
ncbi:hypothetical protein KTI63_11820 [Acinetobacter guillouiae]|uniref:hypothetical protein n=1 Tax=Acinetobacter guillouiae TaxID=106649 RepID=UPI0021D13F4F|nr:hypothetical protein [Acinetobacter guillouiae]MCU4493153.1 hypothetical protein [Acinetobacter guillouiae]